jgi:hypothetical protein
VSLRAPPPPPSRPGRGFSSTADLYPEHTGHVVQDLGRQLFGMHRAEIGSPVAHNSNVCRESSQAPRGFAAFELLSPANDPLAGRRRKELDERRRSAPSHMYERTGPARLRPAYRV